MQIFKDKTFITGIEYRDAEGNPRDGSVIIPEDSEEAQAILEGRAFEIEDGKVRVLEEKRPEKVKEENEKQERDRAAEKEARKRERTEAKKAATLAAIIAKRKAKENLTAKELQDAVDILIDAVFAPDEE